MFATHHKPARRARSGFTLIEVLVALAIAAIGLSFFLSATGVGLQNVVVADQYIVATRIAQSRLAQVGLTVPLKAGNYSGDDRGGFHWQVDIAPPLTYAKGSDTGPAVLGLYPVNVRVRWRSGVSWKEISLPSERIGAP
ncbi:MAG TPA: prepilin-type N-terminal cleavage/methylation domain-containing protein [Rhizomicrobium sp.]|nr:prepilin-type N-terminal cleavage/methylation domain-containing protein [Rhizomicrobium sp.]